MLKKVDDITLLLAALKFASLKHRDQRRKSGDVPYINHPIEVADTLSRVGGVRDIVTIVGALLHDTLEDTNTTPEEIHDLFGEQVLTLVQAVTDNKSLPWYERKRLQIEKAPHKSLRAKQLKLADKICNVYDIVHSPPDNWSLKRCQEYLDWSEQVVAGLRGVNSALETHYDAISAEARNRLNCEL